MIAKIATFMLLLALAVSCVVIPGVLAQEPPRSIHVFVALCDNEHQGIVPVPATLGDGEDPQNNLYWGAQYGVKTFFARSRSWTLLTTIQHPKKNILERCVFRHHTQNVYLVADAYQGSEIKQTVVDFLASVAGQQIENISLDNIAVPIQGGADLMVYVGHNGLMDFRLWTYPKHKDDKPRDAIVLACLSKLYFAEPLEQAGATPVLLTTGLMAPEAYSLESALEGWIRKESPENIRLRAATAYNTYQKCGLTAAKHLFATGGTRD